MSIVRYSFSLTHMPMESPSVTAIKKCYIQIRHLAHIHLHRDHLTVFQISLAVL